MNANINYNDYWNHEGIRIHKSISKIKYSFVTREDRRLSNKDYLKIYCVMGCDGQYYYKEGLPKNFSFGHNINKPRHNRDNSNSNDNDNPNDNPNNKLNDHHFKYVDSNYWRYEKHDILVHITINSIPSGDGINSVKKDNSYTKMRSNTIQLTLEEYRKKYCVHSVNGLWYYNDNLPDDLNLINYELEDYRCVIF